MPSKSEELYQERIEHESWCNFLPKEIAGAERVGTILYYRGDYIGYIPKKLTGDYDAVVKYVAQLIKDTQTTP